MKDAAGALVASVAETGPARDAGLLQGDIITKWDGTAVAKFRDPAAPPSPRPRRARWSISRSFARARR